MSSPTDHSSLRKRKSTPASRTPRRQTSRTRANGEQKWTEETLRQKERLITQMAELAPVVLNVFDLATGRDVYITGDVLNLSGYRPSEIGQFDPISRLVHPDDETIVRGVLARARNAADGEIFEYEYRLRHRNGDWLWLATRLMPLTRDTQGVVRQVVCVTLDVTKRKQAEDTLRQAYEELERRVAERTSELTTLNGDLRKEIVDRKEAQEKLREAHERLEMILDSITDNFFSMTKDWRFNYLNKQARDQMKQIGKDPDRLIGKVVWDEFPNTPSAANLRRVMTERVAITEELYSKTLGEWVENHVYPSGDGGVATFQKYITERKRMEMELQRSEAYLNEAQSLSHTGSGALNVSTGEVFWSPETYRIYGFEPGTVTPSWDLILQRAHPDDRAAMTGSLEEIIRRKRPYASDFRIVRADGALRYCHSTGHPVLNDAGVVTEIIGTIMDITERRNAERERTRLSRRLMTAQEEERRRISREMHDQFGQQLSALSLKIAALKQDCVDQPKLRDQIESLESIATQLDADVESLVWNLRPTALDDLGLQVALSNFVANWARHFDIAANLHTGGMDKERLSGEIETVLYRALQEALTNVAKHAAARNVDILLERRPDHVSLIVEDDGRGFEGEKAFAVGEKGLGLIGMRERVMLVGGTLEIESHPGEGATVAVRVPLTNFHVKGRKN